MDAFVRMGIAGNPWTNHNDAPRANYQDPLVLPTGASGPVQPITWTAFPNKVAWYFSVSQYNPYQVPTPLLYPLADTGRLDPKDPVLRQWASQNGVLKDLEALVKRFPAFASTDLSNFAPVKIPTDVCPVVDWDQDKKDWTKFSASVGGPRGWKDEYNEWVVTRNAAGKITRISFTAENPEYWLTLWNVDPQRVLALYRQLVSPRVHLTDLYLRDAAGKVVTGFDGKPYYNPLNKWNYGNVATDAGGGAVHLTSPPNTVGAEIYLGASASMVRALDAGAYSPVANICAAQYGAPFRNSDPNIGFQANQVARNFGASLTLTNPIALYMQRPDFSNYATPDGTPAESFFTVVRGRTAEEAGTDYDQILHATFEVPPEKGYTVSDIKIGDSQIWWGSQVAETFNQALAATAYTGLPTTDRQRYTDVADREDPTYAWAQPLVENRALRSVLDQPDISAATIPLLPLIVAPGDTLTDMALEVLEGETFAKIEFIDASGVVEPGISVSLKKGYAPPGTRQVPGKHGTHDVFVYVLDIAVSEDVAAGAYGVRVTNKRPGKEREYATYAVPGNLIVALDL